MGVSRGGLQTAIFISVEVAVGLMIADQSHQSVLVDTRPFMHVTPT